MVTGKAFYGQLGPVRQPDRIPLGPPPNRGSLKVVTTKMKAGYWRKNGIPYSADAVITEYYDRFDVPGGDSLLVVSSELVDPAYLSHLTGRARISSSRMMPRVGIQRHGVSTATARISVIMKCEGH